MLGKIREDFFLLVLNFYRLLLAMINNLRNYVIYSNYIVIGMNFIIIKWNNKLLNIANYLYFLIKRGAKDRIYNSHDKNNINSRRSMA